MSRSRQSTTSVEDGTPHECAKCSNGVGSADYYVKCECCRSVYHHKCVGFSDSTFSAFAKLHSAQLVSYFCGTCKARIADQSDRLISQDSSAAATETITEDRLSNVEQQLAKITHTLDILAGNSTTDKCTNATQDKPKSYAAAASKGSTSQARVVTVSDLHTIKEEESHRRSLVIAGLPERGNDLEDVSRLCKFLDPSAAVCDVFRMGRISKGEDGAPGRPRSLKAHMPSSSVVKSVLSEAKHLKDSEDFRGVFVRKSMTLEERQELAKVRARCKSLNEKESVTGVKYVVIGDRIARFKECELQNDRLVGGVRDRDWSTSQSLN